jgi:hypothetical protein
MRALTLIDADVKRYDELIRPVATTIAPYVLDRNIPWPKTFTLPLDELRIRPEVEALVVEIIEGYATLGAATRSALRGLFVKYKHFSWAAVPLWAFNTKEGVRAALILYSLHDQKDDPRDDYLHHILQKAKDSGIDSTTLLIEVAELSNDVPKWRFSTRQRLLSASVPAPK